MIVNCFYLIGNQKTYKATGDHIFHIDLTGSELGVLRVVHAVGA